MESGGRDVHPVAGHDINGSYNKDTWTVYKQVNGIQCRRLAEMYEKIGIYISSAWTMEGARE